MSRRDSLRDIFSGGRTLCVITVFMAASYFRASSPIPAATPAARAPIPALSAGPATPAIRTAARAPAPATAAAPPDLSAGRTPAIPRTRTAPAAAAAGAADAAPALSAARPRALAAARAIPARAGAAAAAITPRRDNRRLRAPYMSPPETAGQPGDRLALSCQSPFIMVYCSYFRWEMTK